MPDDRYVIPEPKLSLWKRIPFNTILSVTAFLVSLFSAIFSYWQYDAANRQALSADKQTALAEKNLEITVKSAEDQRLDVERARRAAEQSADAARVLAEGMQRSARAAEASANAGREALALNRQALQMSEKPVLTILRTRLQLPLIVGKSPTLEISVLNAGKGPAVNIVSRYWCRYQLRSAPMQFTRYTSVEVPYPTLPANATFRPALSQPLNFTLPLTQDVIKGIESRVFRLYFYGELDYKETVDTDRTYTLKWCVEYSPDFPDPQDGRLCRQHNETVFR